MSSDHVPSKYMPGTAECEACHKQRIDFQVRFDENKVCLLYTSPSPRD